MEREVHVSEATQRVAKTPEQSRKVKAASELGNNNTRLSRNIRPMLM